MYYNLVILTLVIYLRSVVHGASNVHLAPLFEAKARLCGISEDHLDSALIKDILAGAYEPIPFNNLDTIMKEIYPRFYGQSCITTPRNPLLYAMVNAGLAKKELNECQNDLFHRIDTTTGCVFQVKSSKQYDPWASPYIMLEENIQRSMNDSVDNIGPFKLSCSDDIKTNKEENSIKVVAVRQRCHLLRILFVNPRCDGEQLRVLAARGDKVLECTDRAVNFLGGAIGLVPSATTTCITQVAATC